MIFLWIFFYTTMHLGILLLFSQTKFKKKFHKIFQKRKKSAKFFFLFKNKLIRVSIRNFLEREEFSKLICIENFLLLVVKFQTLGPKLPLKT